MENKVTGDMLKDLIVQAMADMGMIPIEPLLAEPPTQDEEPLIEERNGKNANPVALAIRLIRSMDDEEQRRVFHAFGVQTYDQFLQALAKYERVKKPK